jgi:hypothetical protein
VSARVVADTLYAVIGTDTGFTLGRLDADTWLELATARTSIAGPMQHANGQRYVGLDGTLQVFDDQQQLRMIDANATVSCLGRNDVGSYACTRDGVHEVLDSGLGAALFLLEDLKAPDLSVLTKLAS